MLQEEQSSVSVLASFVKKFIIINDRQVLPLTESHEVNTFLRFIAHFIYNIYKLLINKIFNTALYVWYKVPCIHNTTDVYMESLGYIN